MQATFPSVLPCHVIHVFLKRLWGHAGQAQPQSFQVQQQQQMQGEKPTTVAPLTIHPDLTLDQNTKILTVGQGEASIFGQKYTLPALPFKLPATPALNSLQSLYPSEHPAFCLYLACMP